MFDIGFWELLVIGVVALLVIGPERLPRVARTAGLWVGRARRFVSSVKADIDRELAADELKKVLAKQAESKSLYEIVEDTKQSIDPEAATRPADQVSDTKAVSDKSHDANG
jgi:sec-independent protein translocase protein TatB